LQDGEEDAGRIGLLMMLAGMLGSILSGIILDKTHKFK
jgi:FLVCR family feline leukemia virus subgroup C receptor-related protein